MTADLTRPRSPAPTGFLPSVLSFTLTSMGLTEQGWAPNIFIGTHDNVSPTLNWLDLPGQMQSLVVSCLDLDVPTTSGWQYWTIVDLDVSVTSLERGAGASDLRFNDTVFCLAEDSGDHVWFGPCPPAGDGDYRYISIVFTLDVGTLGPDDDASSVMAALILAPHCIARVTLTATYSVSGEPGAAASLRDGQ